MPRQNENNTKLLLEMLLRLLIQRRENTRPPIMVSEGCSGNYVILLLPDI
jgi:hypothetical protein